VKIIEKTPREDHQIRIVAEFETEEWENYKRKAARKLSERVRIPGFRPGKAPLDLVRRTVGETAIEELALDTLVDDLYPQVLQLAEVQPGAFGTLDEIISKDPLRLAFLVPLQPEVDLGAYRDIRMDVPQPTVTEKDIDDQIESILLNSAVAEPVERPAQSGDLVYVKYQWAIADAEEEAEPAFSAEESAEYVVDVSPENETPFPGFSKHLVGLTADQQVSFTHEFPEDWEDERFKGKKVLFRVTVQSVKELKKPDLTDEWVQSNYEGINTVGELREAIREVLENTRRRDADNQFLEQYLSRLREQATIKFPPQSLEPEIRSRLAQIDQELKKMGLNIEGYLRFTGKTLEQFIEEEVKPVARRTLEDKLLIEALITSENIQVSAEQVGAIVNDINQRFSSLPKKERKRLGDQINTVLNQRLNNALFDALVDRLKALASGTVEDNKEEGTQVLQSDTIPANVAEEQSASTEAPQATENAVKSEEDRE